MDQRAIPAVVRPHAARRRPGSAHQLRASETDARLGQSVRVGGAEASRLAGGTRPAERDTYVSEEEHDARVAAAILGAVPCVCDLGLARCSPPSCPLRPALARSRAARWRRKQIEASNAHQGWCDRGPAELAGDDTTSEIHPADCQSCSEGPWSDEPDADGLCVHHAKLWRINEYDELVRRA